MMIVEPGEVAIVAIVFLTFTSSWWFLLYTVGSNPVAESLGLFFFAVLLLLFVSRHRQAHRSAE